MEPIERELEDRKARLANMIADVRQLQIQLSTATSDEQASAFRHEISRLRYLIGQSTAGIGELEAIISEGPRPPRIPRPPMPKARRLSVVERQAIEKETRDNVLRTMPHPNEVEVHVTVGRTTDAQGKPQIAIHVASKRRRGPFDAD